MNLLPHLAKTDHHCGLSSVCDGSRLGKSKTREVRLADTSKQGMPIVSRSWMDPHLLYCDRRVTKSGNICGTPTCSPIPKNDTYRASPSRPRSVGRRASQAPPSAPQYETEADNGSLRVFVAKSDSGWPGFIPMSNETRHLNARHGFLHEFLHGLGILENP
jgi:hypothetical protein